MGRHEVDWHDTGAMHWTWPITLKVGLPGALILGAGLVLPSPVPVLVGGLALVVAGCGRIGSSIIERYADRPLTQPPAALFAGTRRRRSTRRLSGFPIGVTLFRRRRSDRPGHPHRRRPVRRTRGLPLLDWAVDYRSNHRAQVRTAARLARLLGDVPAATDAGTAVTTSRRYAPAVVAGFGLLGVVALIGAAFLA